MLKPDPAKRLARRVLLIGWDAADWKIIHPLMDAGEMPHLQGMVDGGVMGNLASLSPMMSPMLWTSIATGKRPYKHGIHGFVEPSPEGALRAVTSTSRTAKAVWNILSQCGLRSVVTGWYAGHPVEPILGAAVSEHYPKAVAPFGQPWPMPASAVHPPELGATLAELRVHPVEIDGYSLLPFVPRAAEVDQRTDERLAILARNLAECTSTHAAATWLMENEEWDFAAVYYPTIDHLCHTFMSYHPPRMDSVPEPDFEMYKDVVRATYRYHDLLLGRLLELAGEHTTVILCSDHGFHSDHLRPPFTPGLPAGGAFWHRRFGIVAAKGPGIRRDERLYGANLLGLTPTILRMFGLPVGADMDGPVWARIFEELPEVETIPSWELVDGPSGQHPPEARFNTWDDRAAMSQLVDLGYMEAPSENVQADLTKAERESRYNLACSYIDGRLPAQAIPVLEKLNDEDPDNPLYSLSLASCYQQTGRGGEARLLAEDALTRSEDPSKRQFARPKTKTAIAATTADEPRLAPEANLLLGMLDLEDGRLGNALERLKKAEQKQPTSPHVYVSIGRTYLRLNQWTDSERAFRKALELDRDEERAHDGLAEALLAQRRNGEAAEHALEAVGLRHHFAAGHFHLGVALARLGHVDRSILAFRNSVAIGGERSGQALRWLRRLERLLDRSAAAANPR